jgi:hypothetical protein
MPAITFTIESDAAVADAWREEIAELIELSSSCPEFVRVARTSGALREASAGKDSELAAIRLALMDTLPEITESGLYGITRYGEGTYAGPEDQETFERILAAVWPNKRVRPDKSEANDVLNLATHLKYKRDHFVTTDTDIINASVLLKGLGIDVVTPSQAAALARSLCQTKAESS